MPTPGDEHAKLKPFEGTFKAVVKIWMGPGDPVESTGTIVNSFQLGGLYLHQDYQGDQVDGPFPSFEGKGYWGFNTTSQQYEGFWIDNASTTMQTEFGTCDEAGKVWEMNSEFIHPMNGETMKKKTVIELVDGDRHSMTAYFVNEGQPDFMNMRIDYQRA